MTVDDEQTQDPVVLRALRRIGALHADPGRGALCPRCGRREVPAGEDWCGPCTTDHAREVRERKRLWWSQQGDYQTQRRNVGAAEAAARWLAHRLRHYDGAADSAQLRADADDAGIPERTLRRGRDRLQASGRLVIEKHGMPRGRSRWRLTTADERDQMANSDRLDT